MLTATPSNETTVSASPYSASMAMVAAGPAHSMTPGGIESARMGIRYSRGKAGASRGNY